MPNRVLVPGIAVALLALTGCIAFDGEPDEWAEDPLPLCPTELPSGNPDAWGPQPLLTFAGDTPDPSGRPFPETTSARWLSTESIEARTRFTFEVVEAAWTFELGAAIDAPAPPAEGLDVELWSDGQSLVVTDADGALLFAFWRAQIEFGPLDRARSAGAVELTAVQRCVAAQDSNFDCYRSFTVYDVEANGDDGSIRIAAGDTSDVVIGGQPYRITHRNVVEQGGDAGMEAYCADLNPAYFSVDVVRTAL